MQLVGTHLSISDQSIYYLKKSDYAKVPRPKTVFFLSSCPWRSQERFAGPIAGKKSFE